MLRSKPRRQWPPPASVKDAEQNDNIVWEGNPPNRGAVDQIPLLIEVGSLYNDAKNCRTPSITKPGDIFTRSNDHFRKNENVCLESNSRDPDRPSRQKSRHQGTYQARFHSQSPPPMSKEEKGTVKGCRLNSLHGIYSRPRSQSGSTIRPKLQDTLRPKRPSFYRSHTSREDVDRYMKSQVLEAQRDEIAHHFVHQSKDPEKQRTSRHQDSLSSRLHHSVGLPQGSDYNSSIVSSLSRSNSTLSDNLRRQSSTSPRPSSRPSSSHRYAAVSNYDNSQRENRRSTENRPNETRHGDRRYSFRAEPKPTMRAPGFGYRDSGYPSPPRTPTFDQKSLSWNSTSSASKPRSSLSRSNTPSPLNSDPQDSFSRPSRSRPSSETHPREPAFHISESNAEIFTPKPLKPYELPGPRLSVFSPGNTKHSPAIDDQTPTPGQKQRSRPPTPETNRPNSRARSPKFVLGEATPLNVMSIIATMPKCPRSQGCRGHNDWYSLDKSPYSSICPDCYNSVIEPTRFRNDFIQDLQPYTSDSILCDFSLPWVRVAWLLTRKQHRSELSILQAMLDNEIHTRSCPGRRQALRSWRTLTDPSSGKLVEPFNACPSCVKSVEIALPPIKGVFVEANSTQPQQCSLRSDGSNFIDYFELLDSAARKAVESNRAPELSRFARLFTISARTDTIRSTKTPSRAEMRPPAMKARASSYSTPQTPYRTPSSPQPRPIPSSKLSRIPPPTKSCTGVTSVTQPWYFPEAFPRLNLCEPCYNTFVLPPLMKDNQVARVFNRSMKFSVPMGPRKCRMVESISRAGLVEAFDRGDVSALAIL